jgi:hypothetical protein
MFTVQAAPGGAQCVSVDGNACRISGLTNGVSYKFSVTATNHAGVGPTSDFSNEVIPVPVCYWLNLSVVGQGTVLVSPLASLGCQPSQYAVGELITLTAIPLEKQALGHWEVPYWTSNNPVDIYMPPQDTSATVTFVPCYLLHVVFYNSSHVASIQVQPQQSGLCSSGYYLAGSSVQLAATCAAGYSFSGWSYLAAVGDDSCGSGILSRDSSFSILTPATNRTVVATCSLSPGQAVSSSVGGRFDTNDQNRGGISEASLNSPSAVIVAPNGDIFVADEYNNRILQYSPGSITAVAVRVLGQRNFNSNGVNSPSLASGLNYPSSMSVNADGGAWVADQENHRVLFYPNASLSVSTLPTATLVLGQGGLTTSTQNWPAGTVTASGFNRPCFVQLDANNGLYVSDLLNHRVLYYIVGGAAASSTPVKVWGQGGSFTSNVLNWPAGAASASSLRTPWATVLDGSGGLYISDYGNHRVLYYPDGSTTATRVYGQYDSFTRTIGNDLGVSAHNFYFPMAIALDEYGLYVSDTENHRIFYFLGTCTTPVRVYGQNGDVTSRETNLGGISANSLNLPQGLAVDPSNGGLWAADAGNHRVLFFPAGSTTATRVFGQQLVVNN